MSTWRIISWSLVWVLTIVWCIGIRPFVPALLPFEPCLPILVLSVMLGPLRAIVPLVCVTGLFLDAFQPFPEPYAIFFVIGYAFLVWSAARFVLAGRSFYSALILVLLGRLLIAGVLTALGPEAAIWSGDRAVIHSALFFFLTSVVDALVLLIGFRLVSSPLLGAKRVGIAR